MHNNIYRHTRVKNLQFLPPQKKKQKTKIDKALNQKKKKKM